MKAVHDEHPLLRANGFEGLEWMPESLAEVAAKGLSDENRAVRFATAMAVGETAIEGMALYLEPLLLDESDSVHAAAIYALRALGEPADPSPLANFIMSDDPETRGNTYVVLGYIGNPSAIPLIQSSLGIGMRLVNPMRVKLTELQAANVLVQLGDQHEVEPIRAALFAPVEQGELTILACEFLSEIGDQQARPMVQRILTAPGKQQRPLEIRLAAAKALFRLGEMPSPGLEGVIMLGVNAEDFRLRAQAAAALVFVPGAHAESVLLAMLEDSDPLVATAAAAAIAQRGASTIGQ
jgi:HEAT repeat protein